MPNTERAFELLDDNRFDEQPEDPTCLWCSQSCDADSSYCSSECEAAAQNDSEEDAEWQQPKAGL